MNVIFLDFDGVIDTSHYNTLEDTEKKVAILAEICKNNNCKVVISSSLKDAIDEDTLEVYNKWIKYVFMLFKKYGIECIGRTPCVNKRISKYSYTSIWKEDEIRLYLFRHPEIEHYCVIDDDDLADMHLISDLEKVRPHLVKTKYYTLNGEEEGLLLAHDKEVKEKLELDNEIRKYALKRKKYSTN